MGAVKRMLEEIAGELGTEDIQDPAVLEEGQRRLASLLTREEEEERRQTEELLEYFGVAERSDGLEGL